MYLNTTFLDPFLPGLIQVYGRDQPVKLGFAPSKAPTSAFKPGSLGIDVTADISVIVNDDVACTIEFFDALGTVSATLSDFLLKI